MQADVSGPPRSTPGLTALVLLLTAALLTVQLRTERMIRRELRVGSPQLAELGFRLRRAEAERRRLETQVTVLREQVAARIHVAGQEQAGLRGLSDEMDRLRTLVGVTAVAGPGVVIEMRDNPRTPAPGEDPNDVLLHYTDLQAVINELWAAGAEAVAINGERFTVGSSVQCVGTTVLVNRRRIAPPFRIEAIGDPALEAYLRRADGQLAYLRAFGFPASVKRSQWLLLPAYGGPIPVTFTRVAH